MEKPTSEKRKAELLSVNGKVGGKQGWKRRRREGIIKKAEF